MRRFGCLFAVAAGFPPLAQPISGIRFLRLFYAFAPLLDYPNIPHRCILSL
jgi:hypothetical protein